MLNERPDAFAMTGDPFHQLHVGWIIDFMAKNRLPAVYQSSRMCVQGGLMSYGASQPDLFRRGARSTAAAGIWRNEICHVDGL